MQVAAFLGSVKTSVLLAWLLAMSFIATIALTASGMLIVGQNGDERIKEAYLPIEVPKLRKEKAVKRGEVRGQ